MLDLSSPEARRAYGETGLARKALRVFAMQKRLCFPQKTQAPNGVPEGIRTPDQRLRRPLLYPAELRAHIKFLMERVMGIEPTQSAWKAEVLPFNYTRVVNAVSDSSTFVRRLLILYKHHYTLSTKIKYFLKVIFPC